MLNLINKQKNIYVVAPSNFATGGPELLHQLAYKLKIGGYNVLMMYLPSGQTNPVHDNYLQYGIGFVNEIEDSKDNVIIVPETSVGFLAGFEKAIRIIWWLSVDNYYLSMPGIAGRVNRFFLNKMNCQRYLFFGESIKGVDYHFVQSQYAEKVLMKHKVSNPVYLEDYLHESFLKVHTDISKKENIVAYNPKKGFAFTKKIMKEAKGIEFVAIEDMTRQEVIELLQRAKVYIDFGFHPGKDRIPREAAFLECCVITNKRGAAGYVKDVPINEEYKFSESRASITGIVKKIEDCFNHFVENNTKFRGYKAEIIKQEQVFDSQLKNIFGL